jgi:hypothetical protein
MFTARDSIIAELMRQERVREAEQHRFYQQLPRSGSSLSEKVAAFIRRAIGRQTTPRRTGQSTTRQVKARGPITGQQA